jgi:hypothetical protein
MAVKETHSSIRLDAATLAIVQKHQAQFGDAPSIGETIQRLVQAADGKQFLTVVSTSVAPHEELSFFAGQLEKTKLLWREVKSRLNAPRPLDPNDVAGLKQWRDERAKIQRFYADCDALWHKAHSLSELLTETSRDDWVNMEDLAMLFTQWEQEYAKAAAKETDPAKRKNHQDYQTLYQNLLAFLRRVGIRPTPPEQSPLKSNPK